MPPQNLERKLAAILSADVAGYSFLMRNDEEATVRTLSDYRGAMGNLIQQYKGRVVDNRKTTFIAAKKPLVFLPEMRYRSTQGSGIAGRAE